MLAAPDRIHTVEEPDPDVSGFEVSPPFPLAGIVGVVVLCVVSAALWAALIWTLFAVVG